MNHATLIPWMMKTSAECNALRWMTPWIMNEMNHAKSEHVDTYTFDDDCSSTMDDTDGLQNITYHNGSDESDEDEPFDVFCDKSKPTIFIHQAVKRDTNTSRLKRTIGIMTSRPSWTLWTNKIRNTRLFCCKTGKTTNNLKMIATRFIWYLEKYGILDKSQCGFRKHRSAMDHLVSLEKYVRDAFARKQQAGGLFFDLEKA